MLRLPRQTLILLAACAMVSLGAYLLASQLTAGLGLPLDDAWIHQTYARNLALLHEWSFLPGQPSAGSTAPLWSFLISLGVIIGINPLLWTYLIGAVCLFGISLVAELAFRKLHPAYRSKVPWIGIVLLLEWHLVWAAGSGMETLIFSLFVTAVLLLLAIGYRTWFILGMIVGISLWIRPDGITLGGPIALMIWAGERHWKNSILDAGKMVAGLSIPIVPYLLFNRILSGGWWPNTFYAKQAEYAVLLQSPLWERLLHEFQIPLTGVGAILIPGALIFFWRAWKKRNWSSFAGLLWWSGYIALYAWRLPVTYQHGRYIIPTIPIFLFWGISGYAEIHSINTYKRWKWVFQRAWQISIIAALAIFWVMGMNAYRQDVAVIQTEMVATAKWISRNTPPDSIIAAHDIGALGYFGDRKIVDLAGLISPDVIPFLRDESRLAEYMDSKNVSYFVSFPDWYPRLSKMALPIFTTGSIYAPQQGQLNMVVYRWIR